MAEVASTSGENELIITTLKSIEDRKFQVEELIKNGQIPDALLVALDDPPLNINDESCKTANWLLVKRTVMAIKDVEASLEKLDSSQCDILMKYLYRGLRSGERATSDQCFKIHEKLTEKCGIGCVVRAISDQRPPL